MSVRGLSPFYRTLGFAFIAILSVGCTNSIFGKLRKTTSQNVSDSNGQSRPPLMVAQIVKNNADPVNTLDLVGDGSGEVGRFCVSLGDPGNVGPSTCRCVFSWTRSDNTRESAEVESVYHEDNLLRCGYAGVIPKDVGSVKIKVLLSTIGAYSNEVDFGVDGSFGTSDATNRDNYVRVRRYQCRDNLTIFQPTPGSDGLTRGLIYDPWQSDDPAFTYPLDFYSSNHGGAMAFFASRGISGWNCPGDPNDTKFGANFRLYSIDPLNGDRVMQLVNRQDPPNPGFDRTNFFVSRSPTSVFKIPLNAYIAPLIISGGSVPSLGYGAAPIANGVGAEKCPDAPKPTGTHWVKVWQFRATLPRRTFVFSTGIQTAGAVICNPTGGIPRDDCSATPGVLNQGNKVESGLADRIFFDQGMCVQFSDPANFVPCGRNRALACTTDDQGGGQFSTYESFAYGTDIYRPYHNCTTLPPKADPLHVCEISALTPGKVPFDVVNTPRVYSPDLTNPRSDYLLVVTPPEVNSSDMVQENRNATPYIPFRYPSASSCTDANPNSTTCPGGFSYGVDLYDVSIPSNPPAGTKQSFPMCALQPDSGVTL